MKLRRFLLFLRLFPIRWAMGSLRVSLSHAATSPALSTNEASIAGKWLELPKEIDPRVVRAAILFNPGTAAGGGSYCLGPFEAAARSMSITPLATPVRSDGDIEAAISALGREPGGGLVMMADIFLLVHRAAFVAQAAQTKVPAV